jgi:hypothetical protein
MFTPRAVANEPNQLNDWFEKQYIVYNFSKTSLGKM